MTSLTLKRVVRRELHSPRTNAAVLVMILVVLAAVYVGTEIVLRLMGSDPLLVSPGIMLTWLREVPDHPQSVILPLGIVTALFGVLLVWLAVSPGRRPKHELTGTRHAVVTDNAVIASSVAERVRRELDLPKGAVVVGIGHRSADVTVRPEPGQTVEKSSIRSVAEAELGTYALSPRVRAHARVLRNTDGEDGS